MAGFLFVLTVAGGGAAPSSSELTALLEPIRKEFKLPALSAVVVLQQQVHARGAVGVRKAGTEVAMTTDDKVHIGSITKSMTATLAALLVEEGKLGWRTTIPEVFPEWTNGIHASYREVTLEQLLSHRAGLPAQPPAAVWRRAWQMQGTAEEQRREFIRAILKDPPEVPPNTRHLYSNAGYVTVGAMIERRAGKPWEDLVRERLFEPLKMKSAGFGAPAAPGPILHPWGHRAGLLGFSAVTPGPSADNPTSMGPAGRVHCTLDDLARFVILHLKGLSGEARLLTVGSFKRLHTPPEGQEYALGWVETRRDWAQGSAFTHAGSNTMFYTVVWASPARGFAVLVSTNCGGDDAAKACDRAAGAIITCYLGSRPAAAEPSR